MSIRFLENGLIAIEYHRKPTKAEIKRGYGCTHYREFLANEFLNKQGKPKKWLVCSSDGLRYYR